MTWKEFKNWVDSKLTEEEQNLELFYIDTGNYPEINKFGLDVYKDKNIAIH